MKSKLIILGAGEHAREVRSYLADLMDMKQAPELVGLIDDRLSAGPWDDSRILGGLDALDQLVKAQPRQAFVYITAMGNNDHRKNMVQRVEQLGAANLQAWPLVHPKAYLGKQVEIGDGSLVAPGAILTTGVRVGRHCIINVKASLSHDCQLGDFANINPGATLAGCVRVDPGAFIGAGATVIQGIRIGAGAIVGAGAVVIEEVPAHVTVVGVPARVIKRHSV